MKRLSVGDEVEYQRSSDGTRVRGTVAALIFRGDPGVGPVGDEVAYRLKLSAEDQARIGHPVVIGATRVLPTTKTKTKADDFHAHLDACERCRNQPFNLCNKGLWMLQLVSSALTSFAPSA